HPAIASSIWADMLISGPGDSEPGAFGPDAFGPGGFGPGDSGPYGAGDPGWYGAGQRADGPPGEDAPNWPSSGLPPSFGQRPVAGERPDFEDAALPPAGPASGAHHPLTPQPGPAGYGVVEPEVPEPGLAESGAAGYGVVDGPAQPAPRGWSGTEAAFGPSETYETETRYEPAVGYGVVPGPEPVRGDNGVAETSDQPGADDGTYGSYGVGPPRAQAPTRDPEEPPVPSRFPA